MFVAKSKFLIEEYKNALEMFVNKQSAAMILTLLRI